MTSGAAESVLRDLASVPAAAVEIEDGTEHFRGGAIRLTLRGSGSVEVEHRRAGTSERYSADLSSERVAEVAGRLADSGLLTLRAPQRPLVPGETLVELTLRQGDETLHTASIPSGDEDLDGILDCFTELVYEASGGVLPPRAGG